MTEPANRPPDAAEEAADAVGGGLDMVLVDAARGPLRRLVPPAGTTLRFVSALARRPGAVAGRTGELVREVGKVVVGSSELEPSRKDKRFADPAWSGNPLLRRAMQAHLATARVAWELIEDADLDWQDDERIRFTATNLVDALAPSNVPVLNPLSLKAVIDTGGRSALVGLGRMLRDFATPPRVPSMVEPDAFTVGEDLATTPGVVVLRTPVFELIRYRPTTETVREVPLVIVPPTINKYYITDLAPDRSMVEHLVRHGQQVFTISWRNPDQRHAEWGLEEYVQAVLEALDAVDDIGGSGKAHVLGLCAGGITLSVALAVLAARGEQDRIAGVTLGVSVLDNARSGTTAAFVDRRVARMAIADSARRGYLDGRQLAGVFAWLRPNDLIWNYWVNNYLLGKQPPAFDILYWNADSTNLPAKLHRDFLEISLENPLVRPGALKVLGVRIDLSRITADSYVVAGIADHITPWENCYRTTQMLGSEPRFVLSTSGHIAALVNPPGNEKASYQVNDHNPAGAEQWLQGAAKHRGTWWDDWASWLGERSGEERPAPAELGSARFAPDGPAPGRYVLEPAG